MTRLKAVESVGGEGSLTWADFVLGLEEPDDKVMRKQRQTFNAFLAELKDLVGDDASSTEVHETAFVVFNLLADASQSDQAKLAVLAKVVRVEHPPKNVVASLQAHVSSLSEWKKALAAASGLASDASNNSSNNNQQQREFGRDVLFSFNAPDFLFREPVRVSKTSEVVRFARKPEDAPKPAPTAAAAAAKPAPQPQQAALVPAGNWLEEACFRHCAAAPSSSTSASDLVNSIVAVAKSAPSAEAFQGQLFDLLGVEGLDLMELVVSQWASVKAMTAGASQQAPSASRAAGAAPPTTGSMVVTLERDKKGQQRRRKQEIKAAKQQQQQQQPSGGPAGPELEAYAKAIVQGDRTALPTVDRNDYIPGGSVRMAEAKFAMPEGAVRVDTPEYESVWLPPKRPPFRSDDSLVPITEFPTWARTAFKGYEKLNRVQSAVYQSAYFSNENLLICAPTGAGKTNIAMLAILREISLNRSDDGRVLKEQFKIIYVAPMKVRSFVAGAFLHCASLICFSRARAGPGGRNDGGLLESLGVARDRRQGVDGRHAAYEAGDRGHADYRDDAREVGRHHAQVHRLAAHAAGAFAHSGRGALAQRRSWSRH